MDDRWASTDSSLVLIVVVIVGAFHVINGRESA
mgnify:CR=1 FL=1